MELVFVPFIFADSEKCGFGGLILCTISAYFSTFYQSSVVPILRLVVRNANSQNNYEGILIGQLSSVFQITINSMAKYWFIKYYMIPRQYSTYGEFAFI